MDLFGEEETYEEADEEIIEREIDESAFGHPRHATLCIGHETPEKQILDMLASGRLPHGLVFAGPRGIGKATFAYRLARYLLKQGIKDPNQDSLFGAPEPANPVSLEISPNDPVFSRVASGGHADLFTVERLYDSGKDKFKNTVEVDEIRKVAPFLRKTASEGGWRVVIIDDADTMTRNAQNSLLKILEEPPQNTLLILIAHRAGALIPTIKSRTSTINFQPLNDENFETLLEKRGDDLSREEMLILQRLARGSFGHALEIIDADGIALSTRVLDLFENYPRFNWVEIHKFADGFGNSEEGLRMFSEITNSIFAQLAKTKATGAEITGFGVHKPLMQNLLNNFTLTGLLNIAENLQNHFSKITTGNLDRRQGVITAFSLIS